MGRRTFACFVKTEFSFHWLQIRKCMKPLGLCWLAISRFIPVPMDPRHQSRSVSTQAPRLEAYVSQISSCLSFSHVVGYTPPNFPKLLVYVYCKLNVSRQLYITVHVYPDDYILQYMCIYTTVYYSTCVSTQLYITVHVYLGTHASRQLYITVKST